ncbi:MAG: HD-GYP domain-containing protein [Pseudomonadota bacterium]|jgi:HD-GYP domain-containing protein (c-di-GMP phosphodiesterase class II)
MLKRIPVENLRPGMFVNSLCGSWLSHAFWRKRFEVKSREDIARLARGGVRDVMIDTERGLDIDRPLAEAAPSPSPRTPLPVAAAAPTAARVAVEEELEQAARVCRQARAGMVSMFAEARMGHAVDTSSAMGLVEDIGASIERNPLALVSMARLKSADDYTFMHSVAVCGLMLALGRQLGLEGDELREAGLAGLLHDLGKAQISASLLNKPARLDEAEWREIRRHPVLGHALLERAGSAAEIALDVCLNHHERMDGGGYPAGLDGSRLSLHARMASVCDVYDAITSNRPYKAGWDPGESIRRMAEWAPEHFDERVFKAFVRSVGIYPVGSLVRMASGRLGVVIDQGERSLTTPRVKLFFSTSAGIHIPPQVIDLSRRDATDRIVAREAPADWNFTDLDRIWAGEQAPGSDA